MLLNERCPILLLVDLIVNKRYEMYHNELPFEVRMAHEVARAGLAYTEKRVAEEVPKNQEYSDLLDQIKERVFDITETVDYYRT